MKKILIPILILLCIPLSLLFLSNEKGMDNGQKYVPGEIMIQITPGNDNLDIEKEFDHLNIKSKQLLSRRMNLWLLEFETSDYTDEQVLSTIRHSDKVQLAQFNHFIQRRETIPTDSRFDDQWALKNTGQSGGTVDADIDATEAWDIVTGDWTTALGDTIVIAIIDGGIDTAHSDLKLWKNYHEVPNNLIDDDDNGYVDDYLGWSAYTNSDRIPRDDHGTHVAGIAGAKTDNDMGVAGVIWNAQLMAIAASSTVESVAVVGYAYALEQRSRYNETDGAEGAFIVVTNSSFGVDYGQPEDFPIWCAMFDSLGAQGVLSVGSGPNANWNVDEIGDVPTGCASDYLISATNTTKTDIKNVSAGWGPTTIDIGAPGTVIMSTRAYNNYGNKSGTSMSSPHISGAIALLFAGADADLMQEYMDDPGNVSLSFKQYIMDGVDIRPTLQNITVSEGRLNVYNSLMIMENPPVLSKSTDEINKELSPAQLDSTSFILGNVGGNSLDFNLRISGNPNWITIEPDTGSIAAGEEMEIKLYFNTIGVWNGTYYFDLIINHNYYNYDQIALNLDIHPFTSISEKDNGFKLYPNPAINQISLEFDSFISNGYLSVYDQSARSVLQQKLESTDKTKVDVSHLEQGQYILVIMEGNSIVGKEKLIIR